MGIAIPQVVTEDRASGAQVIDGSLRFDRVSDSVNRGYLTRTFSDGNSKKWTWSAWIKRDNIASTNRVFGGNNGTATDADITTILFDTANLLKFGGYNTFFRTSSVPFRDIAGWYHLVAHVDIENSVSSLKYRAWVNGEEVVWGSSSDSTNTGLNRAGFTAYLGAEVYSGSASNGFGGKMSQCYFIDGQALGPENFGYTDPLTNTWRPKKFDIRAEVAKNPNNGTTWSSSNTGVANDGTSAPANAFDGNLSTQVYGSGGANTEMYYDIPDTTVTSTVRVHIAQHSETGVRFYARDTDGIEYTYTTAAPYAKKWVDIPGIAGKTINRLGAQRNSTGHGTAHYAWEIDGYVLINGAGDNSFYLPMDGNSPIGEDKSGITNVNNGTIWSANVSASTGSIVDAELGFDGNTSSSSAYASDNSADTFIYIDFSPALSGAFKLWTGMASGTRTATVTHSGGSSEIELSAGENSLGTFTSVTRIAVNRGAASTHSFRAISVDGVILIDGVKGNSWTPTNFGGSNTIEKATGALPILNTLGGTIARSGVFGSEVGKTYTVTAAGGKFYLDGSVNPALTSLVKGATYKFDTSDSSNNTHPFIFGTTAEGANYTDGVARSHNDGTTWGSSFVSSSGNFGVGDANTCFDGDITTRNGIDNASGNGTLTLTVDFKNVHKVEVLTGLQNTVSINGGSVIGTASADPAWVTYEPGTAFNLTTITIACAQAGTGGYRVDCYGIKVDNVLLVNNLNDRYTKITVPHNVPNTFYYHCGVHSAMGNSISGSILDETKADPYAWKNTLALPLIGSANDVSNQINIGSSTKTVTVTNATASSAQSNFYGGSYNFTSSSTSTSEQYLDVSPFITATSSWTLEFWIYRTQDTNNFGYIFNDDTAGALSCGENTSGQLNVGRDWFTAQTTYTPAIPLNTWTHFACSVSDGVATQYLNGVAVTTDSNMGITRTPTVDMRIGGEPRRDFSSNGRQFFGYLQDIRFYNGVAKYTSNFIPASTDPDILPDTLSGVSGGSKLTKVTGGGAVRFPGGLDYLSLPYSSDLNLSNNDFCIEFWMYPEIPFDANDNGIISFGENLGSSKEFNFTGYTGSSGTGLRIMGSSDGSNADIFNYVHVGTATIGAWQHIAIVRNGSSFKVYKNGTEIYSTDISTTSFYAQTTRSVVLGEYFNSGLPSGTAFQGYLSNVRVVIGSAVYTANFTPPTEPLTNITNTKLLCCQSNTSATAAAVSPGTFVNDGTNYSSNSQVTGSAGLAEVDSIFNGWLKQSGVAASGQGAYVDVSGDNYILWTPTTGIPYSSKVEVFCYAPNGYNITTYYTFNGGSETSFTSGAANFNGNAWITVATGSGTINSIKLRLTRSPGSSNVNWYAVRVDGTILINDYNGKTISRVGLAGATNFNPFMTGDINTVRGQETGYATLGPIRGYNQTLSNGNLTCQTSSGWVGSTIDVSSGKYYVEFTPTVNTIQMFGICSSEHTSNAYPWQTAAAKDHTYYVADGRFYTNAIQKASGYGAAVGDTIAFAFDVDSREVKTYKNGVRINTLTISKSSSYMFYISDGGGAASSNVNFGQKPFKYAPPEGFQPVNAANVRSANLIVRPDQYVGVTTFSIPNDGSGGTVTLGNDFDMVWTKNRTNTATNHVLQDSVRGYGDNKSIHPNLTVQQTSTQNITAVNGRTLTIGSNSNYYGNNVAWYWKAGGSSNTYNIDDVGYANASDVNMSVGALNSSVYNQTSTWSNNWTASGNGFGTRPVTNIFDSDFSNFMNNDAGGQKITWNTSSYSLSGNLKIYCSGDDYYVYVNGIYVGRPPTNKGFIDCGSFDSINEIMFAGSKYNTTDGLGVAGVYVTRIEVDGKILVDNGISMPNAPSIAPSACSVGTKQGFSIIKYTGNETARATVPHGLSQNPNFIMIKNLDQNSTSWLVVHTSVDFTPDYSYFGAEYYMMRIDRDTPANYSADLVFPGNGGVFELGSSGSTWSNGPYNYIAYCWHDVPGVQKFGRYTGNNTTNNIFIDLGFRPAMVWIKNITSGGTNSYHWCMYDSERSKSNPNGTVLWASSDTNENNAGFSPTDAPAGDGEIDFLSNGFKLRSSGSAMGGPEDYIYCAWAEAPSSNLLYGGQANAR